MEIPVDYKVAKAKYPDAVKTVIAKLRAGKSKHNQARPESLKWSYSWCIRVEGFAFAQLISGEAEKLRVNEDAMTEEEAVQDRVRRSGVSLQGSKGHWSGYELLKEIPSELVEAHRQAIRTKRAEKAAYDALPQAEKERQFHEALGQLRGTPGFMELPILARKENPKMRTVKQPPLGAAALKRLNDRQPLRTGDLLYADIQVGSNEIGATKLYTVIAESWREHPEHKGEMAIVLRLEEYTEP